MVCVRPGVLLVKASLFWPVRALIRLDFPTLLLPKNATSGSRSDGKAAGWAELTMNSAFKNVVAQTLSAPALLRRVEFQPPGQSPAAAARTVPPPTRF